MLELYNPKLDKSPYCILYVVYCTSVLLFIYRSGTSLMKVKLVVVYFKERIRCPPTAVHWGRGLTLRPYTIYVCL